MDDEPKVFPENLTESDSLKTSIELANKAFGLASNLLTSQSNAESSRYKHLDQVADSGHVLFLDDLEMTESLQKLGFDTEHAKKIPAIYMGERGGVLVDAVVVRKGIEVDPLVILHEFVHRASAIGGLHGQESSFDEQAYKILDFSKEARQELKKRSPDDYKKRLNDVKDEIRTFNEGITQWTTLYLANNMPGYNPPVERQAYHSEVTALNKWLDTLSKKGLSKEQIDSLVLDLALTGDFSKFRKVLPVGQDLIDQGISPDFSIATFIRGVNTSASLSKLERILGK